MDVYKHMADFRKMFGNNPTRSINKEYYEWKISDNPYCPGYIYLEFKEGIVTGATTITPKKIACLGKELMAAELGDGFTHPGYRKQGIFSRCLTKCTEYAISEGAYIIYGTPNEQALAIETNLGYPSCQYAKLKSMYKYFSINPLEQAFRRRFGRKHLSKYLSHVYFYYLSFLSFIQKKKAVLDPLTLEIKSMSQFEDEVDGLWGLPRKDYVFFVIRDKKYLNWRFFSNPDQYTVLAAKTNNVLLGYIVLKISKNEDYCIGSICDFITYQDRIDVFKYLLTEADSFFHKAGVDFIQLLCSLNSPYFETIRNFGYLIRRDRPIIVYSGTEIGKQIHSTDDKWHFTLADSDNI